MSTDGGLRAITQQFDDKFAFVGPTFVRPASEHPEFRRKLSDVDATVSDIHAAALVTTDYESTAWLSFYLPNHPPVIQANQPQRYPDTPVPGARLLSQPLLYVVEPRLDKHAELAAYFSSVQEVAHFDRLRHGVPIAHYVLYRLEGWHGQAFGRMP